MPVLRLFAGIDRLDKDLTVGQMQGNMFFILSQHAYFKYRFEKLTETVATSQIISLSYMFATSRDVSFQT